MKKRVLSVFWVTSLHQLICPDSSSSLCPQCDGVPMPLPSLQGLAVLNIPSYAGGINFWGGTKEDNVSAVYSHPLRSSVSKASSNQSFFLKNGELSGLKVAFMCIVCSLRTLALRHLTIRSWRWWLCLAACRWPCPESSTCSTTALRR